MTHRFPLHFTAFIFVWVLAASVAVGNQGEVGSVTVTQAAGQWQSVTLNHTYVNPVVVMGPPSTNDPDPALTRVRNVTATSFEFMIEEWDYQDGVHGMETVSYLVVEAGAHTFVNGAFVEAGILTNVTDSIVTFYNQMASPFVDPPLVLVQCVTVNDPAAATAHVKNINRFGFQLHMQEEEAADGVHGGEDVAWVAIQGSVLGGDRQYSAVGQGAGNIVASELRTVFFPQNGFTENSPFLGEMQSFSSTDPADMRRLEIEDNKTTLFIQEETSNDPFVDTGFEKVGFIIFKTGGDLPFDPHPPVAVDDVIVLNPGGMAKINVLTNDTDPDVDIDPGTLIVTTPPSSGSVDVDTVNGMITYTHTGPPVASDTFFYEVSDAHALVSNIAMVTVNFDSSDRLPNTTMSFPPELSEGSYRLENAFLLPFNISTTIVSPPGETNRLFVTEKSGRVWVIPDLSSPTPTKELFLDFSGVVTNTNEQGLLGMVFHPDYAQNGYFYLTYTTSESGSGRRRLSRFKVSRGGGMSVDSLSAGTHVLTAAVTDSNGNSAVDSVTVVVYPAGGNLPPAVDITSPLDGATYAPGENVSFIASATDDIDDDTALTASLTWNSDRDGALGTGGSVSIGTLSLGTHTITASVTDSGGLPAADAITLTVSNAALPYSEDLVLRLEATDGVGTFAGNTVLGWLDQSGQGNSLISSGNPQLAAGLTPSGQPAIRFDGNGDRLERKHSDDPLNGLPTGNADRSMFIVARYIDSEAWGGVAYGKGSNNQAFGLVVQHPTGELVLQGWGGGNDLVSVEPGIGAGWLVQSGVQDGGTATLYKDGTQIAQFAHTYNTVLDRLMIGKEIKNNDYMEMDVAAVLIYDRALNASERASVENYLDAKYLETAPSLSITDPPDGSIFSPGASVDLTATASDPEDGDLTGSITWSSDLDGGLGAGGSLSTSSLSAGTHTITASVMDSGGLPASDGIIVTIGADPVLSIGSPLDGQAFEEGTPIFLTAAAIDAVDDNGALTDSISWSSDLDGSLGSGNPNEGDPNSEQIFINQVDSSLDHKGGDMHFGPIDGYLYMTIGDGGSHFNSQVLDGGFFSAIMRIDVDKKPGNLEPNNHSAIVKDGNGNAYYSVPADNPFVGATTYNGEPVNAAAVRSEFWATGFRNPWKMCIDSVTGQIFTGDVGDFSIEEVNIVVKGGNYGWKYKEGLNDGQFAGQVPPGFVGIDPIHWYWHSGPAAVISGLVYRGPSLPELDGAYLFADHQANKIWALREDGGGGWAAELLANQAATTCFGIDPSNGDILVGVKDSNSISRLKANASLSDSGLPPNLTQTGAFADLATLTPNPGLVPYKPIVRFWSDYADKKRWFAVPDLADKMTWTEEGAWGYPEGTIWVKHFDLEMERGNPASKKRVETRFLVRTTAGGYGVSYRWNASEDEAVLVAPEGENIEYNIIDGGMPETQTWRIPGRSECMQCHTLAGGYALSFNTRQLNCDSQIFGLNQNQITALDDAGYLANAPAPPNTLPSFAPADDTTRSLEERVRSYLAVNCVQCHQPGGSAPTTWDARPGITLEETGLVNGQAGNDGGDSNNKLIVPGSTSNSILLHRMSACCGFTRMPPLGTNELDDEAIQLVTDWITQELPLQTSYQEWRLFHFGSDTSPEGEMSADFDGDKVTNDIEFLTMTDPTDRDSRWTPSVDVSGGNITLAFERVANRSFQVLVTDNLENWELWDVPGNAPTFGAATVPAILQGPIDLQNQPKLFFRWIISEP